MFLSHDGARMFDKPDSSIPTDEWLALSTSEQEFCHFIYEIYEHFDLVITQNLGWKAIDVKINQGTNNIVIGFSYLGDRYIFRVPKIGIQQLKTIMCIRQELNGKPYFIDIVYYDHKCLIERYAEGELLSEFSSPHSFAELAVVMGDIHSYSGEKFGPLIYSNVGAANDFQSYYVKGIDKVWAEMEKYLKFEQNKLSMLKHYWNLVLEETNSDPVICHGDLWHNNIFYSTDSQKITLIDWERCGVYHKEKDLRFLISKSVTEEQRNIFLANYPYDIDDRLLHWYSFTMQLKYCRLADIQNFIDEANIFLNIMIEKSPINDSRNV